MVIRVMHKTFMYHMDAGPGRKVSVPRQISVAARGGQPGPQAVAGRVLQGGLTILYISLVAADSQIASGLVQ